MNETDPISSTSPNRPLAQRGPSHMKSSSEFEEPMSQFEIAERTFQEAVKAGLDPANPRDPREPGAPFIPQVAWKLSPWSQWSFQHIREMAPTAPIWRGSGSVQALPQSPQPVGDIIVNFRDGKRTVNDHLERSYTDGFLVLHRGRIVFERYLNNLAPQTQHLLMSATKSFTGTLAGILAGKGLFDVRRPVTDFLPELGVTGYRGATVQQCLDMTTGIAADDSGNLGTVGEKMDYCWYRARPSSWLRTYWEIALSIGEQVRPHGAKFDYKSIDTAVVGFVLQRVTGLSMADLLSQEIWAPMRAQEDAYVVLDDSGFGLASGGMCATLRDFGRFAQLMTQGGILDGRRILPQSWIEETLNRKTAPVEGDQSLAYYSNFWWVDAKHRALWAVGHGGQQAYVEPDAEFAAVKLSYFPEYDTDERFGDDRAAILAIRAALSEE